MHAGPHGRSAPSQVGQPLLMGKLQLRHPVLIAALICCQIEGLSRLPAQASVPKRLRFEVDVLAWSVGTKAQRLFCSRRGA